MFSPQIMLIYSTTDPFNIISINLAGKIKPVVFSTPNGRTHCIDLLATLIAYSVGRFLLSNLTINLDTSYAIFSPVIIHIQLLLNLHNEWAIN
jgi:hypothetical protein